jgi:glucitol operon activator protein
LDYLGLVILVVGLWILQFIFTFFQSQAMTKRFVDVKNNNVGNHLGIGLTRAKFNAGRGVIVIVVTDINGIVRDFQALSGYSVMARFKQLKKFIGVSAKDVEAQITDKRLLKTFQQAIDKINEEREKNGFTKIELINN